MALRLLEPPVRGLLDRAEAECERCSFGDARRLYEVAAQELTAPQELPPRALAFYGLALAHTERKRVADAIGFCRQALRRDGFDPTLWFVLASIYKLAGSKRRSIEAILRGLRIDPTHRRLIELLRKFGIRSRPVFGSLRRGHPVNRLFGRLRHSLRRR